MPPKRKLSSVSSSSSEASKRVRREENAAGTRSETVNKRADLTVIKTVEETVKKKINEELSSTQTQILTAIAHFQQQ